MNATTLAIQMRHAAVLGIALLVTACAGTPEAPEGAAAARAELTRLQSDPQLATRAPQALQEAEAAVVAAEQPENDDAKASHRVFMAERKVALARALATARLAEDERAQLAQQRDEARLRERTEEAIAARDQAVMAQAAAAGAQQQAAELQREIEALRAKTTDQGLVLTLGDVLFATGRADLKPGAVADLDRLVTFLAKYPERTVIIEGHTDNVGSTESNMTLSRNRAESVRSYLTQHGVGPGRIDARGMGESVPVAANDSAGGRQQNRRVEIIVSNR
jgi:outer membrane protein OmpA-like peptidoglycan-associated protein